MKLQKLTVSETDDGHQLVEIQISDSVAYQDERQFVLAKVLIEKPPSKRTVDGLKLDALDATRRLLEQAFAEIERPLRGNG